METAPFYRDLGRGPDNGFARWLITNDGVRIRIGVWPSGQKGTVLMFSGRTEYIEKYADAASEFGSRGYASIAIDWRGQGIADRLIADRRFGHVNHFQDYQHDVQAVLSALTELDMPKPYYLAAHSMGGCIGLRALLNGFPVNAVAFSAPMWGIRFDPGMKFAAKLISSAAIPLGFGPRLAPGRAALSDNVLDHFPNNELTCDEDMFAWMCGHLDHVPDFNIGGPTIQWAGEAIREMADLSGEKSPDVPVVTFLGTDETIVLPEAIKTRMAKWEGGELVYVKGGKHEVMMEIPASRQSFFDRSTGLFGRFT